MPFLGLKIGSAVRAVPDPRKERSRGALRTPANGGFGGINDRACRKGTVRRYAAHGIRDREPGAGGERKNGGPANRTNRTSTLRKPRSDGPGNPKPMDAGRGPAMHGTNPVEPEPNGPTHEATKQARDVDTKA